MPIIKLTKNTAILFGLLTTLTFQSNAFGEEETSQLENTSQIEDTEPAREPASNRQYRPRSQTISPRTLPMIVPIYPNAEVRQRPQQQPRSAPPVYIPVPVYVQAPTPPPKKSPPLVGLVLTGILGFEMGSEGNQSFENPGFGLVVGYAASPIWTLGISGQLIDATPGDLGPGGGATAVLQVVTGVIEYHFPGLESLHVGVRAGTAFRVSSFSNPLAGTSRIIAPAYGGYVGWNFQLIDPLGLTPQIGFMRFATPIPITDMEIHLGIRYWPFR